MPIFTIQAPDGRKVDIEAADEATALRGAQEWAASQTPAKPSGRANDKTGNPVLDFVARSNNKGMDRLDASNARREARRDNPVPVFQPGKDALTPATAATDAWKKAYNTPSGKDPLGLNLLGAIGSTVAAPFVALSNQVVNPLARLGERAGVGDEVENTNALNTALAGAKPGTAAPVRAPKPNPVRETVQRFDRAGVQPNLAAARGKGSATIANVVAENPIAGIPARGRLKAQATQAGAKADKLAGGYGEARGAQITGENVQGGVTRYAGDRNAPTSFAAKADKLYTDVFAKIDEAQSAQVGKRADMTGVGGGKGPVPYSPVHAAESEATLGVLANRAGGKIGSIISDPKLSTIAEAVMRDRGITTFGDLRALRTWVRTAQRDPQLRQGVDDAALQSLERALTADIMTNAQGLAGPQVAHELRRADQFYRAGSERIQKALQPFANAGSGESAYSRIVQAAGSTSSADAQKLLSLKRSLSADEWGDVASNIITNLGKPSPAAGVDEGFSVSNFVTNYAKMSDKGREVLFGSTGGGGGKATALKSELDNLASVVADLKAVERGANASKTAVNAQGIATLGGLTILPVTIKILGTMAVAGEVMTNPAFVRWLARAPRVPQAQSLNQLSRLAATSPAISAYRQRLLEEIAAQNGGDKQPVGRNVDVPELQAEPAPLP